MLPVPMWYWSVWGRPNRKNGFSVIKAACRDIWMALGATVDFEAGNVKRAPKWMQMLAMEWFYRFLMEPKRMFRRYFVDDVKFFWYFGRQLLGIYRNPFKS